MDVYHDTEILRLAAEAVEESNKKAAGGLNKTMKSILQYPGSKWRIAKQIVSLYRRTIHIWSLISEVELFCLIKADPT